MFVSRAEMIKEHKKLIPMLRKHGEIKEAQKQAKELKEITMGNSYDSLAKKYKVKDTTPGALLNAFHKGKKEAISKHSKVAFSPEKAKAILEEKKPTLRGHAITPKQKRWLGFQAGL